MRKPQLNKSARIFMMTGIISSGCAVGFGAFGAHALKQTLSAYSLQIFQTAVNYQMWHSIGLILIGLSLNLILPSRLLNISAWFMLGGIILFSGSLFALSISGLRWLGMITPLGGLFFLIAWTLFAIAIYRSDSPR